MALPTCGGILSQLKSNYYQAYWQTQLAWADEGEAEDDLSPFKDHYAALNHIIDELAHIRSALNSLTYRYGDYVSYNGVLVAYLTECVGGDEFNMDTLLSTMLAADPDQVKYFVGLVDAYRQSIWNQPFNEEFFAALARGFEQWP